MKLFIKRLEILTRTLFFTSLLWGCAHIVPSSQIQHHTNSKDQGKTELSPSGIVRNYTYESQKDALDMAVSKEVIKESATNFLEDRKNSKVKFWIKYFGTKNKDQFLRFTKNGEKYRTVIENIFEKYGLPKELYYVGLIESGYQNHARSTANAVGPWQFIKPTAIRYGLKVNSKIDERRNIYKSTEAAALFFQDLYNIFGSWELALAGYNAGEYGIIRRIRKANTRKYYELSRRKIIPKETRHYVPKVLAVMELDQNKEKYGLNIKKDPHSIYNKTISKKIFQRMTLSSMSKRTKTPLHILKVLNPDIRRGYIPRYRSGIEVYLPSNSTVSVTPKPKVMKKLVKKNTSQSKEKAKAKIDTFLGKVSNIKSYKVVHKEIHNQTHKVRRNESLYSISKRYNTKLSVLKSYNKISGNRIYPGQVLKLPFGEFGHVKYSYTVKKGDSLHLISKKYQLPLKKLKKMNKLSSSTLQVGQQLKVPAHKVRYYTVKRGDALLKIARNHQVSLNQIKLLNGRYTHTIYPGQKILIQINLI